MPKGHESGRWQFMPLLKGGKIVQIRRQGWATTSILPWISERSSWGWLWLPERRWHTCCTHPIWGQALYCIQHNLVSWFHHFASRLALHYDAPHCPLSKASCRLVLILAGRIASVLCLSITSCVGWRIYDTDWALYMSIMWYVLQWRITLCRLLRDIVCRIANAIETGIVFMITAMEEPAFIVDPDEDMSSIDVLAEYVKCGSPSAVKCKVHLWPSRFIGASCHTLLQHQSWII